jgi:hypothetical protein
MADEKLSDLRARELEEQLALARAERDDALFREHVAEEAVRQLIRHGHVGVVGDLLLWSESPTAGKLRHGVAYLAQRIDDEDANR